MQVQDSMDENKFYQKKDMERVKECKRGFLEIQKEYYEKRLKDFNSIQSPALLLSNEAKNDVLRAKENKIKGEKMQAEDFLKKYDMRIVEENKKRLAEIKQKHNEKMQLKQNQKKDIELVLENKKKFQDIQKEYYEKRLKQLNEQDKEDVINSQINDAKRDILLAKRNKRTVEKIQAEYFLQKYDLMLVKENKKRLEDIKATSLCKTVNNIKPYNCKETQTDKKEDNLKAIPLVPPFEITKINEEKKEKKEKITNQILSDDSKLIEEKKENLAKSDDISFKSLNRTNHEGHN